MVAVCEGSCGEERFDLIPRRPEEIAPAIRVQCFFIAPVAVRRAAVGEARTLPEFEVLAAGNVADPWRDAIEVLEKHVDGVGAERHADDADEHGVGC